MDKMVQGLPYSPSFNSNSSGGSKEAVTRGSASLARQQFNFKATQNEKSNQRPLHRGSSPKMGKKKLASKRYEGMGKELDYMGKRKVIRVSGKKQEHRGKCIRNGESNDDQLEDYEAAAADQPHRA